MGSVKVIESFVAARSPARQSEDVLVVTEAFVAIVDGAGLPQAAEIAASSAGRFVAEVIADVVRRLPRDTSVEGAVASMTGAVRDALIDEGIALSQGEIRPAASVLIYSVRRHEVWRVGAGTVRYGAFSRSASPPIESLRGAARAAFLHACRRLDPAIPYDELNEPPDYLLQVQHAFQNADDHRYGFGVIDGTPVPRRFVECFRLEDVQDVILASDGYPRVADTLEETEAYLFERLRQDPLLINDEPETKRVAPGAESFDDRTYVRISRGVGG